MLYETTLTRPLFVPSFSPDDHSRPKSGSWSSSSLVSIRRRFCQNLLFLTAGDDDDEEGSGRSKVLLVCASSSVFFSSGGGSLLPLLLLPLIIASVKFSHFVWNFNDHFSKRKTHIFLDQKAHRYYVFRKRRSRDESEEEEGWAERFFVGRGRE